MWIRFLLRMSTRMKWKENWTSVKIIKIGDLNEHAYEDPINFINTSSSVAKIAFGLVKNAKNEDLPEENCKIAWDRLVSKYTP